MVSPVIPSIPIPAIDIEIKIKEGPFVIGSEYKKFEKILIVTLNILQSELIDQKIFQSELYLNEEIRNKIDSGNIQIKT